MTIINDVHLELSRCVDVAIELREQRDALLEASLEALAMLRIYYQPNADGSTPTIDKLRKAIALAGGDYDHDSEAAEKDRGLGYVD